MFWFCFNLILDMIWFETKKKYVTYICLNVCIYQYFMYIFHPVLPLSTTPQPPKRSNFTAPNSHVDGDIWHDKYQENAPKSKINQFCLNDLSSTEMNWIIGVVARVPTIFLIFCIKPYRDIPNEKKTKTATFAYMHKVW